MEVCVSTGATGGWSLGSEEHKRRFCSTFVDTHDPYRPEDLAWPELDATSLARLRGLPVWEEAVNTERETALRIDSLARTEPDPVLREAIALQAFEEHRHFRLLELLTGRYGIPITQRRDPDVPDDPNWAFMRVGYAECFDSFFAFGLFDLARRSGFFPPALVDIFEPVLQEEARHILFFANWKAWRRQRTPAWARPAHTFDSGLAASLQVIARVRLALSLGSSEGAPDDNFLLNSQQAFGDISPRGFVETCLRESDRRLSPYDPHLARPRLAPTVARWALRVLPGGADATPPPWPTSSSS
jgi:hypothetical protein